MLQRLPSPWFTRFLFTALTTCLLLVYPSSCSPTRISLDHNELKFESTVDRTDTNRLARAISATPNNSSVAGYNYAGCYPDSESALLGSTRYLLGDRSYTSATGMTWNACTTFCNGYQYGGITGGSTCRCGNSLAFSTVPVLDTLCSTSCTGNSLQSCGSSNRLTVFRLANSVSASSSPSAAVVSSALVALSSATSQALVVVPLISRPSTLSTVSSLVAAPTSPTALAPQIAALGLGALAPVLGFGSALLSSASSPLVVPATLIGPALAAAQPSSSSEFTPATLIGPALSFVGPIPQATTISSSLTATATFVGLPLSTILSIAQSPAPTASPSSVLALSLSTATQSPASQPLIQAPVAPILNLPASLLGLPSPAAVATPTPVPQLAPSSTSVFGLPVGVVASSPAAFTPLALAIGSLGELPVGPVLPTTTSSTSISSLELSTRRPYSVAPVFQLPSSSGLPSVNAASAAAGTAIPENGIFAAQLFGLPDGTAAPAAVPLLAAAPLPASYNIFGSQLLGPQLNSAVAIPLAVAPVATPLLPAAVFPAPPTLPTVLPTLPALPIVLPTLPALPAVLAALPILPTVPPTTSTPPTVLAALPTLPTVLAALPIPPDVLPALPTVLPALPTLLTVLPVLPTLPTVLPTNPDLVAQLSPSVIAQQLGAFAPEITSAPAVLVPNTSPSEQQLNLPSDDATPWWVVTDFLPAHGLSTGPSYLPLPPLPIPQATAIQSQGSLPTLLNFLEPSLGPSPSAIDLQSQESLPTLTNLLVPPSGPLLSAIDPGSPITDDQAAPFLGAFSFDPDDLPWPFAPPYSPQAQAPVLSPSFRQDAQGNLPTKKDITNRYASSNSAERSDIETGQLIAKVWTYTFYDNSQVQIDDTFLSPLTDILGYLPDGTRIGLDSAGVFIGWEKRVPYGPEMQSVMSRFWLPPPQYFI